MNKIHKLGNQNRELYIEDRLEDTVPKYKLTYDKEFDKFKFIRVNGVKVCNL